MTQSQHDQHWMQRALELARAGCGEVEPNPPVGCVIARNDQLISEGYHQRFGGPHAEVVALEAAHGPLEGATLYVTLEPCCHQGKTPPCTDAIIAAGIQRVVIASGDPFPAVAGQGVQQLRDSGVEVVEGVEQQAAERLLGPYRKRVLTGEPWVIAKWAMTLDGRIATRSGDSKWISGATSRELVHRLRGRVDAILVGRGTVVADDPLLTARPPGSRTALRVVLTRSGQLPADCQLLQTAADIPLLVCCHESAAAEACDSITASGAELLVIEGSDDLIPQLLAELGRRQLTHLLVEGGAETLGAFRDGDHIDEVHAFVAPRMVGGQHAPGPLGGKGSEKLADALELDDPQLETCDGDIYIHGRVAGHDF